MLCMVQPICLTDCTLVRLGGLFGEGLDLGVDHG